MRNPTTLNTTGNKYKIIQIQLEIKKIEIKIQLEIDRKGRKDRKYRV